MAVERRLSTPYHVQSTEMSERFNGTLKTTLQERAVNNRTHGTSHFPQFRLRLGRYLTQNLQEGYALFILMYGRQVRRPVDNIADVCSVSDNKIEGFTFVNSYARICKTI
ncbi:hypothetical protein PoB_000434400 [Plakobranchus ocellatus]|uniref:Integrase catalytic domain-containing protein n=1 Tax=Plakobranchus ocellatus TaxID=259542 RepID=A0AAV3Y6E6_9GAST|nr:hypothetical protein PoB_000434400 [Plakobranchus ocellatus]